MKRLQLLVTVAACALLTFLPLLPGAVHAQAAGEFSLQVTPSPLVTTLKPGTTTELELKIRNAGSATETLKIEPRSFRINGDSTNVTLDDTTPPDVASWISFSAPTFSIKPGEWYTQKVRFALPKDTGFSYSFALIISRKDNPKPTDGGRLIKGSVAVFTLVNVDRPGATRSLETQNFSVSKHTYEYLPASFTVRLHNTGNTIVQPYGNIFISRGDNSEPLATLPVNKTRGYILPGSSRSLTAGWTDGFPAYKTTTNSDGSTSQKLVWDWSKVANFRIGRYTAKLVAVYNDGQRDVPLEETVSFWVIPWKILLGLLVVTLLLLFSVWTIVRKLIRLAKRLRRGKPTPPAATES